MRKLLAALLAVLLMASAASAITVTKKEINFLGTWRIATCRILFDSSYAASGEALTLQSLGMTRVLFSLAIPDTVTAAGYGFHYDDVAETIIAFAPSVVTNPASFDIVDPNDDAGADTIAVDVPSTTGTFTRAEASGNLATVKAQLLIIGY